MNPRTREGHTWAPFRPRAIPVRPACPEGITTSTYWTSPGSKDTSVSRGAVGRVPAGTTTRNDSIRVATSPPWPGGAGRGGNGVPAPGGGRPGPDRGRPGGRGGGRSRGGPRGD